MFTKYFNVRYISYTIIFVLIVLCSYFLVISARTSTDEVFWDTMSQNLHINSVTIATEQTVQDTIISQTKELQFKSQLLVRVTNTVQKNGQDVQSVVTTESVGTKDGNHTRYTKLFSSYHGGLENHLNKWAYDVVPSTQQENLLTRSLATTPILFGNLTNEQQDTILQQLKERNVYSFSDQAVTKKQTNRLKTYDYMVTININEYVIVYKQYLSMIGLSEAAKSISEVAEPTSLNIVMTMNLISRQVILLHSDDPNVGDQTLSNYDKNLAIVVPQKTDLSSAELENGVKVQVR